MYLLKSLYSILETRFELQRSKKGIVHHFQNATAGTKVFQVVAHDPDDPNTSNGKIVYSLPDDGTIIRKLFQLDPGSGVLTTKVRFKVESCDSL